jgi:hypothetical protein
VRFWKRQNVSVLLSTILLNPRQPPNSPTSGLSTAPCSREPLAPPCLSFRPYSARIGVDRRFSKSQDERLACFCVYDILQATVNKMVKDEKETVPEKVLYSGGEGVGLSFEKLDEKMQSWGRKKFGDRYAQDLWRDELMDLKSLKLGTDELYDFAFNIHYSEVYDMLSEDNCRQADGLFYSDRF